MKKFTILLSTMLFYAVLGYSQVAINTNGVPPDSSAILDLSSTNRGLLLPRMTTFQISNISNPAAGLQVYNTDSNDFYGYNGSKWISFLDTNDTISPWVCGDPIIDSRDGQSYNTVQIGTQCWMAENLNIGIMINGSNDQTDNGTIEKYCYDNNTANCDTYGGLYQWDEMMQYVTTEGTQGICPTGWHVPTDAEWCTLENYVDSGTILCNTTGPRGTDAGGNLKETGTTHWASNTGATNSSGFTGLPGGYRYTNSYFYQLGYCAMFWSSNENGTDAWYRLLSYNNAQVERNNYTKVQGSSVRCIKD